MQKKRTEIKTKFISHLMKNGKKKTSEKILLKSFKKLQKHSSKKSEKLLKLALIYSTPTFKLHKITNKKLKKRNKKPREIPAFISNQKSRISLAIKLILKNIKKKEKLKFYEKLEKEILLNTKNKSSGIQIKNELQKNVLAKKHYFLYYRWY